MFTVPYLCRDVLVAIQPSLSVFSFNRRVSLSLRVCPPNVNRVCMNSIVVQK